jgi:molybdate transport system substrate-binding protein
MKNNIIKKLSILLVLSLFVFSLSACNNSTPAKDEGEKPVDKTPEEIVELTISAAISLQDALTELKETYESNNENVKLIYNFGSSGSLMKQIEEGAEVDLFLSAAKKQMDELEEKDLLINESRVDLLSNDLVLLVNENYKDKVKTVDDLLNLKDEKIAMGEPESVPAGRYTAEALTNLGLYDKLTDNIVFAKNVRQVVTYVDSENTVAGFCYGSDSIIAKNSTIAEVVKEDSHKPIVYPATVIKDTKNIDEAQKFLDFLKTDEALKVFEDYGFKKVK